MLILRLAQSPYIYNAQSAHSSEPKLLSPEKRILEPSLNTKGVPTLTCLPSIWLEHQPRVNGDF
jgi:hypothetical protein